MKTAHDPRHKKRAKIIKKLYEYTFHESEDSSVIQPILEKKQELDKIIRKYAPEWPIEKLNKVDLAILRLAVYELISKQAPPKVVIDEAVELAKEYGSENSPKFVNGVLGSFWEKKDED